jgi:hypothetical protein
MHILQSSGKIRNTKRGIQYIAGGNKDSGINKRESKHVKKGEKILTQILSVVNICRYTL